MNNLLKLILLLSIAVTCSVGFISNQKIIQARLIRINSGGTTLLKSDTIFFEKIFIHENETVDLKFCLEKFNYPPNLPADIFWVKPDTTEKSIDDTNHFRYKYSYDEKGRVTTYFYQGSLVSGIFPLPYSFQYSSKTGNQIKSIKDVFYKNTYLIHYNESNIHTVEKLDSLNTRLELLLIEKNNVKKI